MRAGRQPGSLLLLAWAALAAGPAAFSQEPIAQTELIRAENWELVFAHCSACHSLGIVTGQRGSRNRWLAMIRWMQETQNLWQFEPATEEKILDYLAENYGTPDWPARRPPLAPHLMPGAPEDG